MLKYFLSIILILNPLLSSEAIADGQKELESYVENLMDDTHKILSDKSLSKQDVREKVASLLRSNLYLKWMAKQSLGRNFRAITPEEFSQFYKIYSSFIVGSYTELASDYSNNKGQLIRVNEIRDNLFMVDTKILSSDGDIMVKYLVHKIVKNNKTHFLVGDVITSGISLIDSQRSEFKEVFGRSGIKGLMKELENKNF